MITHVVCFKLGSLDNAREARRRLMALRGVVPTLREIECGVDTSRGDRSWDLALITRFDDREGLKAYAAHPAHTAVVEWMRTVSKGAAVVDFDS